MKASIFIVMALALAAAIGCKTTGSRGGRAAKEEGVRISVPGSETNLKQGEAQLITISLQRGDYFKQDVTLDIKTNAGITVEPTSILIKASDKPEVQVRIAAAKDAPLGDCRVYLKGTPVTGIPATADFGVKVVSP